MKLKYQLLSAFVLMLIFSSCEPEEEKVLSFAGDAIYFSTDTVQFDTLLTGTALEVSNITKRVIAYNPNSKAVQFSFIKLAGGSSSPYQLFINGAQTEAINNVTLFGGDSLLLLVSIQNIPQNRDLPYLVKDSILFQSNGIQKDVKLIAYGQDANYLEKGYLPCDQVWEAGKAYVLKDTVWVPENCVLSITKGAKIYFNNNAALFVEGTLNAIGDKEERIIFSNSRLDLKNQLGLWAGIHFLPSSRDNIILFSNIRNAGTGISLQIVDEDTLPDLVIGNSIIENTAGPGIFAESADLYVYNSLINNSPENIIRHVGGGNYTYEHCTIVNYATLGFSSQSPVAFFSNIPLADEDPKFLDVKLYNNIIWSGGNLSYQADLKFDTLTENVTVDMGYNLIRSTEAFHELSNSLISTENDYPDFVGIFQFNYQIDSVSPAINAGTQLDFLIDLEGNERDSLPDIGAYEYQNR